MHSKMLIIGAKGFAKEVLEVLWQADTQIPYAFYDDVSTDLPALVHGRFPVLRSLDEAEQWFTTDRRFVLGVGNPQVRQQLTQKLRRAGGVLTRSVSPKATIGHFDNHFGAGCNIMTGTAITSSVTLEEGVLVNLNCTIGHDAVIGAYSELCPGVHISGHVQVGAACVLGTGAVVLPGVSIGDYAVIGAGSVVTRDVAPYSVAVGAPAKAIKTRAMKMA
jgi:sugar O-acyltransferase (sialic acid O-acetyltransferase NeuD family)